MGDEYTDWFFSKLDREHLIRHRVITRTGRTVCGERYAAECAPIRTISKNRYVHSECPLCFPRNDTTEA